MRIGQFTGFSVEMKPPGIAWFTFTTPERMNGMTTSIKRDLIEAVTQAQMDNAVRVLVFTGTGRAFCAGDDLKGYRDADIEGYALVPAIPAGHDSELGTYNALRVISQKLNSTLRSLDKLTIAAINGVAIQTGFSLALSCDFRIASESARMGSATLRFGLLPDEGGQYLLVQHLGLARALDFMLRKRIVDAQQAQALGLVSEVVAPDALEATTLELATELAEGPQVAMRLLKRSIYTASEATWEGALEDIAAKTAISDHHADAAEGVRAFKEKRQPQFNDWLNQRR
mgnify:CR=1 FL=1